MSEDDPDNTVLPIKPGIVMRGQDDMLEFVAQRINDFCEIHGHEPETMAVAMWCEAPDGELKHATVMMTRGRSTSKIQGYATAAALMLAKAR